MIWHHAIFAIFATVSLYRYLTRNVSQIIIKRHLNMSSSSDSDNPEPLKKKQKNPDTYKRNVIKHAKVKGLQHANWRGNIILPRRTGPDCK